MPETASRRRGRVPALALVASALVAAGAAEVPSAAREGAPRRVPRATSPIVVDGQLDEAAWAAALVIELPYEVSPGDNIAARVRTEALLTYDDARLYAGFRAYDPEPQKIRARLSDRDRAFQDDFVGIVIDTFNDERRAFEFFVNALGVQMDLIQDDVNGREDSSWDAIWDSAGRVNGEGYEVEMAIPYSSLRFQRGAGEQVWGLDVIRIYPRGQRYLLASNPRDRDVNCYLCQVAKIVGFENAEPGKNLEVTPTLTAGRSETPGAPAEDDYEPGLTVRWGVTPNLTLSGTANPDFSQVEADVAQLDVNQQFALFFPEKRPFFLEGADFFETPIDAVYTRTVASPSGGAKLTGKEGKHALGAFVARDRSDTLNLLIPGNQGSTFRQLDDDFDVGVFRYRRDVGDNSAVGALLTSRDGDGYRNRVFGFDTSVRATEADQIRFQFLRSRTEYPTTVVEDANIPSFRRGISAQPAGSFDDRAISFRYTHRKREYGVRASYTDYGADFRADLGFVPRVDFRQAIVGGWYTWWQEPDSKFSWYEVGGDWDQTEDQNGQLIEREVEGSFLASGPWQSFLFVGAGRRTRVFNGVEFRQTFVNTFFEISPTRDLYTRIAYNRSDREDVVFSRAPRVARQGDETSSSAGIRYHFGRHLLADLSHDYRTLELDAGHLFRANLSQLRLVHQFSVRMFVRAIVQHFEVRHNTALYPFCPDPLAFPCSDPESRSVFGQFLFSYKLNPQTALFAGYTDTRTASAGTDLEPAGETLFFKIGYAWVP